MVPRLEFGHLAKFLASVGLLLIAASILLPWIFMQSVATLSTPSDKIDALTPTAKLILLRRQDAISFVQEYLLLPAAIVIFVLGVASLVWGLLRWQKRQSSEDLRDDLSLEAAKAQIEPASIDEIEEKQFTEASEEQEPPRLQQPSGAPIAQDPDPAPVRETALRNRMAQAKAAETRLAQLSNDAYGDVFDVRTQMRVTTQEGGAARILDVLLDPAEDSDWGQLALDVALVSPRMVWSRIPEAMVRTALSTRGLRSGNVYSGNRGRPATAAIRGIQIYLLDEEPDDRTLHRIRVTVEEVNSVLRLPVGVLLFSHDRFQKLRTDEFRSHVSSVWSFSGENPVIRF